MVGRKKTDLSDPFTEKLFRNRKVFQCKFCEQIYSQRNVTKMKKHLLKRCNRCPLDMKKKFEKGKFLAVNNVTNVRAHNDDIDDMNLESPSTSSTLSTCSGGLRPGTPGRDSAIPNVMSSTDLTSSSRSITPFVDRMDKLSRQKAHTLLTRAILASGTPLSIVEHPLWKECMGFLRPAYEMPSRKTLANSLLNQEYEFVKDDVEKNIAQAKYLCLQCDGWSNIKNEGIINFVVTTPEPWYVASVETKDERHTAEYIKNEIHNILVKYGPEKFTAIITDNAANMRKATRMLQEQYPHITAFGCLSHTLHLLIQDILNCKTIQEVRKSAVEIVTTIKKSQILYSCFNVIRQEKKCSKTLVLPVATRWGSTLFCLQSLLACKNVLQTLAVNEKALGVLGKQDKRLILDDAGFWMQVGTVKEVLEPVVKWILKLEGDEGYVNLVYKAFDEIGHMLENSAKEFLNKEEYLELKDQFHARRTFALKPIHFAAYQLDPSTQGYNLEQNEQMEAIQFIINMFKNMNENKEEDIILNDLANYRAGEGFWKQQFLWTSVEKMKPLIWWKGLCIGTELQTVASRILSTVATSAATERSFSTAASIHTPRRNRLNTNRALNITYIAHYWRHKLSSKNKKRKRELRSNTDEDIEERETRGIEDEEQCQKEEEEIQVREVEETERTESEPGEDFETNEKDDDEDEDIFIIFEDEESESESESEPE